MGILIQIKFRWLCLTIFCVFLFGTGLLFLGLSKGRDIASYLSRPHGVNSWPVSEELIIGTTYTFSIAGLFLRSLLLFLQ